MHLKFLNIKFLIFIAGPVLFAIYFVSQCSAFGESDDLNHILNALSGEAADLSGYTITATQTTILLNQKSNLLSFARSNSVFGKNTTVRLGELAGTMSDAETNVAIVIYKFSNTETSITTRQYNWSGQLTYSQETLITSNEVWQSNETSGPAEKSKTRGGWAKISNRVANGLYGIPIFLSKRMIYDRIITSTVHDCNLEVSSSGQVCYTITISGSPNTRVSNYKYYFDTNSLAPVGVNAYFTNGVLFSEAALEFNAVGVEPLLCRKATAKLLHGQSIWELGQVEKNNIIQASATDKLIPMGTRVIDERLTNAKVYYHMGIRPPATNEVVLMANDKHGVAAYERSTLRPPPSDPAVSRGTMKLARIIFFAIMVSPVLIYFLMKRKTA